MFPLSLACQGSIAESRIIVLIADGTAKSTPRLLLFGLYQMVWGWTLPCTTGGDPEPQSWVPAVKSPSGNRVSVLFCHTLHKPLYIHISVLCAVGHGIHLLFPPPLNCQNKKNQIPFPLPGLPFCHLQSSCFPWPSQPPWPTQDLKWKPTQTTNSVNSKTKNRFYF